MNWFMLFVAGLMEIGWAVGIKYSEGFTKLIPSAVTILAMVVSVVLLGFAVKTLPVGTAYAVWAGIGAAGTVIYGMIFLGESASPIRIICVALIITGIIGLNLTSD